MPELEVDEKTKELIERYMALCLVKYSVDIISRILSERRDLFSNLESE